MDRNGLFRLLHLTFVICNIGKKLFASFQSGYENRPSLFFVKQLKRWVEEERYVTFCLHFEIMT